MTVDLVTAVLVLGVAAYAVFGGADFGAGFWDLTAGGAARGARVRGLVKRSMSPVWEANHVWLIFVLVVFWTAFPAALPTGTRPHAIAPTAAPSANGASSDATANSVSILASSRSERPAERSAYAAPRKMIPIPAANNGIESVEAIEPNAIGYAVQNTVRTKISHTWLASQTGAIE